MIIDGKSIAEDLKGKIARSLARFAQKPTLAILVVGEDPVIENFVRIKKRFAEALGIPLIEHRFPAVAPGETLKSALKALGDNPAVSGIIVQLPLPAHIDTEAILNAIPTEKDVDMLARTSVIAFCEGKAKILPPVVGAIQEILEREKVDIAGKEVLVLGHGRLVGVPAAIFFQHNNAHVTVIDQPVADLAIHVRESSIIVSGVGKPGLLLPEMFAPGAVLIDAGASEAGGRIVGDADSRCAEILGVFTPVPGGVGPIAVAMIFKNLCILAREHS